MALVEISFNFLYHFPIRANPTKVDTRRDRLLFRGFKIAIEPQRSGRIATKDFKYFRMEQNLSCNSTTPLRSDCDF
jgi:hypothetical protein